MPDGATAFCHADWTHEEPGPPLQLPSRSCCWARRVLPAEFNCRPAGPQDHILLTEKSCWAAGRRGGRLAERGLGPQSAPTLPAGEFRH